MEREEDTNQGKKRRVKKSEEALVSFLFIPT